MSRIGQTNPGLRMNCGFTLALAVMGAVGCGPRDNAPPFPPRESGAKEASASVAFLYAYEIDAGKDSAFFAGYRRHLDWHAGQRDSLAWLGWSVSAGEGLGLFVNGVFGVPAAALDARVDPAGDSADGQRNIDAHADPAYRHQYRVRTDLSTAARLEESDPASMQHVVWITPAPGARDALEAALRSLADSGRELLGYTVYERIAGGPLPAFLLIVQVENWAELSEQTRDPLQILLDSAGNSVAHVSSEVWKFRADLTYIPKSAAPHE